MSQNKEYVFKIVLLGEPAVGKTSLVIQYTERKFNQNYLMTLGSNFALKVMKFPEENLIVRLQLWDLAGQKHFQFVRPAFYRGAFVKIFIFDITRRDSFEKIEDWLKEANTYIPEAVCFLVGNKTDLMEERVVSRKEGVAMAERIGALNYYETSAKTADNVDQMFEELTHHLVDVNIKKIQK